MSNNKYGNGRSEMMTSFEGNLSRDSSKEKKGISLNQKSGSATTNLSAE